MNYTKEEMQDLVIELKGYGDTFWALTDFFEHCLTEGMFEDGFSEPGSLGSAVAILRMKELFPDAWYAISLDKLQLPIQMKPGQEKPIAVWRLRIGK